LLKQPFSFDELYAERAATACGELEVIHLPRRAARSARPLRPLGDPRFGLSGSAKRPAPSSQRSALGKNLHIGVVVSPAVFLNSARKRGGLTEQLTGSSRTKAR
jgi:hypothetical protein